MARIEMKCTYHPTNLASAHCYSCGRNLCPACDHRIKGAPYCQDCIVAGIDILRRGEHRLPGRDKEKSPFLALVLSLVPGLGAAYNGQNVKALAHFMVPVGLWTLADVFHKPFELTFGLAGAAFYLYAIYDAYASAQRQRAGENLQEEDDRIKYFLREKTNIWGGLLVGTGVLATLNMIFPDQFYRFWPLLLIFAGGYFLKGYYRGQYREPPVKTVYRTPPPSVIPSAYDRSTGDFAKK